jgi:heme/copper-type cytochrome/quinol oxidase subunit 4
MDVCGAVGVSAERLEVTIELEDRVELTKQHGDGAASYASGLGRYLFVYVCILFIAGLQFVIAYRHVDVATMIFRMFALALLEAGLAVVFFMHLGSENRLFATWVAVVTIFVLVAMQYSWTDSFRMERDAPPSYQTPVSSTPSQ